MVIGAPTAPCGRIVRSRWVVAVITVRVIIRVVEVRVREDRAKRESSKPKRDRGSRADPTATPATTCIRGPRRRRQPDNGEDRRGDGQTPTSFPEKPVNGHISPLSLSTVAPRETIRGSH